MANITIRIVDTDYIYGSTAPESQSFTLDELTNGEGTFKYVDGHTYSISASHAIWNEETGRYENPTSLSINDWLGQGTTITGFNQIIDGKLTLVSLPTEAIITLND